MEQYNYDQDDLHLHNTESGFTQYALSHPLYDWPEVPFQSLGMRMSPDNWFNQMPQDFPWSDTAEPNPNNAPASAHKLAPGPAAVAQHMDPQPNLMATGNINGRENLQRPAMAQMAAKTKRLRRPAPHQSALNLDWDAHQDHIRKLYINEHKSLEETRQIVSSQFDFFAS